MRERERERESGQVECAADGTTEPCGKSLPCDSNDSNKEEEEKNKQTLGFHTAVYHQQTLNSTVETRHKLHVLIA